ncbi:hypothetical protein HDU97_000573 [Phlyctochytrium planicorne]|nr:hypothetical protein HDU97_000573 [Phlyctochytrium planicorne]
MASCVRRGSAGIMRAASSACGSANAPTAAAANFVFACSRKPTSTSIMGEKCQCRSSSSSQVLRATMLPLSFDNLAGRHYYTQPTNSSPPSEDHPSLSVQHLSTPTAAPFDPAAFMDLAPSSSSSPSPTISTSNYMQAMHQTILQTTNQVSLPPPPPTTAPSSTPSSSNVTNTNSTSTTSPTTIPPIDKTFYRRELPPSLVSLNSPQGRLLIKQSLASGFAEAFLQLSGNLAHQSDPAFCGLSSLAMVLNALEIDPKRQWKGVWRWYDETLLDCCAPLEQIRKKGMTFDEFGCLARCNGLDVESRYGNEVTYEQFLHDVKAVTSGDGSVQMVVAFSRKLLDQTGDGHFSPIGAFHSDEKKVLVLDVARFKYPSYFTPIEKLFEALKPVDKETGRPRGYFLLRKANQSSMPLCKIVVPESRSLFTPLEANLRLQPQDNLPATLNTIVSASIAEILDPSTTTSILPRIVFKEPGIDLAGHDRDLLFEEHEVELSRLIDEIKSQPIFPDIQAAVIALTQDDDGRNKKNGTVYPNDPHELCLIRRPPPESEDIDRLSAMATLFVLTLPKSIIDSAPEAARSELLNAREHAVSVLASGGPLTSPPHLWSSFYPSNRGPAPKFPLLKGETERLASQIESLVIKGEKSGSGRTCFCNGSCSYS